MIPAALGGPPAFDRPLCVGAPRVEAETRALYYRLMDDAFDRAYLTNDGPHVREFERRIGELHQVEYCAAICNATIAQIILLKALRLCGEVILPSFTFVATAHAVLWENLTPVFCDIDEETCMADPKHVESLITSRTCAIIGAHLFGNVCDAPALEAIAHRLGLALLFDAAHAFGCSLGDRTVGGFGKAEFLSFHATKFFGTFEGGAILTNDSEIHRHSRMLRNFGFRTYDDVGFLGINGKMSESSAAMGLASLPRVSERIERNRITYEAYRRRLGAIPGISVLPVGQQGRSNYQYFVAFVDSEAFGLSRDVLVDALWRENILARKYFYPGCHKMDFYCNRFREAMPSLPVTDSVGARIVCFPMNLEFPERDTERIAEVVSNVKDHAREMVEWNRRDNSNASSS
ncbi:DegT/DnrJ/EryC1/StrS family aminotransferase [Candidatus Sumerlaeota bacterium]|nr:DegT/DnrJ/EryC1/StrS family aminotransferase [Candidatus Sumerlaeota bacterium]